MLAERGQVNGARALAVAADLGLDTEQIKAAMQKPDVQATINEVYGLAAKLNLSGTPSYVTPKEVVVGAVGYDALKEKIKAIRDCTTANC
jgi:protein-disulfide isomerase